MRDQQTNLPHCIYLWIIGIQHCLFLFSCWGLFRLIITETVVLTEMLWPNKVKNILYLTFSCFLCVCEARQFFWKLFEKMWGERKQEVCLQERTQASSKRRLQAKKCKDKQVRCILKGEHGLEQQVYESRITPVMPVSLLEQRDLN